MKDTPHRNKRTHDYTAISEAEHGSNESAPMDEQPLTVWTINQQPRSMNYPTTSDSSPRSKRDNFTIEHRNTTTDSHHIHPMTLLTHHTNPIVHRRQSPQINHSRQRFEKAQVEWAKFFQTRPINDIHNRYRPITLTQLNQRQNQPCGNAFRKKDRNTTKVYSLNLNGISSDRRWGQFHDLCEIAREIYADIICWLGHNIVTSQSVVRSTLYETLCQHRPQFRLQTGTTSQQFTQWY